MGGRRVVSTGMLQKEFAIKLLDSCIYGCQHCHEGGGAVRQRDTAKAC